MEITTIAIIVLSLLLLSLGCFYIAHVGRLKQENLQLKKKLQRKEEEHKESVRKIEEYIQLTKAGIKKAESEIVQPILYSNYRI